MIIIVIIIILIIIPIVMTIIITDIITIVIIIVIILIIITIIEPAVHWQSARKVSWLLAGQVDPLGAPLEITQRLVNEYCDSMSFAPTRPCTSECETWAAEALDALPLGDGGCPVVQCHMKAQLRCSAGASRPAMHPG